MELDQVPKLLAKLAQLSRGEKQDITLNECLSQRDIRGIKTLMNQHLMRFTIRRKTLLPPVYTFTRI